MGIKVHNIDGIKDSNRSVRVTFNDVCEVHRYRNKYAERGRLGRQSYKTSLWYTDEDYERFEDDFVEDRACQKWIERQRIRNFPEVAWRSLRLSSLRMVSDPKKRPNNLTATEKTIDRGKSTSQSIRDFSHGNKKQYLPKMNLCQNE